MELQTTFIVYYHVIPVLQAILWTTDYMMRNAGDFENAVILYPIFQADATNLAQKLALPTTHKTFSLSQEELQREYFNRFEALCVEIKKAGPDVKRLTA